MAKQTNGHIPWGILYKVNLCECHHAWSTSHEMIKGPCCHDEAMLDYEWTGITSINLPEWQVFTTRPRMLWSQVTSSLSLCWTDNYKRDVRHTKESVQRVAGKTWPLFTKRADLLPQDVMKSRSRDSYVEFSNCSEIWLAPLAVALPRCLSLSFVNGWVISYHTI